MRSLSCDLLVIGGGPAGYEAAAHAGKLGLKTVLIEKEHLGGTCLNWGCIPTKLFLGATAAIEELAAQARLRLASGSPAIDLPALQKRKGQLLKGSRQAIAAMLAKAGVTVIEGVGSLVSARAAEAATPEGAVRVSFEKCLLATGSRPAAFPGLTPDGEAVLDSTAILDLDAAPASLIVVGSGAIGLEMGQFFHRLGTKIVLVEAAAELAPLEDPEVGAALRAIFKRKGWEIHLGAKVERLANVNGQAEAVLSTGQTLQAAKALLAVGRRPNTESLGLEKLGVRFTPAGYVLTDENLRAADGVYAPGDVNGRILLAHAASHQALYCVDHAAGRTSAPYDGALTPSCVYGAPEVMRVGRSVAELRQAGREPQVSRFQLAANPIAQAYAAPHGLVKCVWDGDRLAGVTAAGHGVAALTVPAALMIRAGWTRAEAEAFIFPHPALDEALKEALLAPLQAE